MRFLYFLAFLLIIDLYAFQALRLTAQNWAGNWRNLAYFAYWSTPVLAAALLALSGSIPGTGPLKTAFTLATALLFIIYLSKFIVLPFLLIDDLRRAALWAGSRLLPGEVADTGRAGFLSKLGLAIGAIPFVTLTYGMIRNPYRYRVFRSKVRIDGLAPSLRGLRIVQISDIHSGSFLFKDPVKTAIELINREEPDLVFFTGDLVNEVADEMTPFMDVFDRIRARFGVFSVLGNHDYGDYASWPDPESKTANLHKLKDIHRRLGWELLNNEHRILRINGAEVAVIGVENYSAWDRFPRHGDLAKAYSGAEKAGLKLLLSHDPSHWDAQVTKDFSDIQLTFSGHTHGMQFGIEVPGFIKWSPIKYLYRQWAGLYQKGSQYLYVNRGLGYLGYPGRVGILPEITVVELA